MSLSHTLKGDIIKGDDFLELSTVQIRQRKRRCSPSLVMKQCRSESAASPVSNRNTDSSTIDCRGLQVSQKSCIDVGWTEGQFELVKIYLKRPHMRRFLHKVWKQLTQRSHEYTCNVMEKSSFIKVPRVDIGTKRMTETMSSV